VAGPTSIQGLASTPNGVQQPNSWQGSTEAEPCRTSKCRWGPVEKPVEPDSPPPAAPYHLEGKGVLRLQWHPNRPARGSAPPANWLVFVKREVRM